MQVVEHKRQRIDLGHGYHKARHGPEEPCLILRPAASTRALWSGVDKSRAVASSSTVSLRERCGTPRSMSLMLRWLTKARSASSS